MTSKERLLCAIRHKEADKVPVAPRIANYIRKHYGSDDWTCYRRIAKMFDFDVFTEIMPNINNYFRVLGSDYTDLPDVKVEKKVYNDGDAKIVERVFDTPEGKLRDVTKVFPQDDTYGIYADPIKSEFLVKDENDLNKLKYIFPEPFKCDLGGIGNTQEALGEDGLVGVYMFGLLGYRGGEGRNIQDLMVDYYENKQFLKDYLSILHQQIMKELKACLEAGTEVIFGSNYYEGISAGWSPQHFKELFLPLYKQQVDLVHEYGAIYWYYDDGKLTANIDNFAELGIDVLQTMCPLPMGDVDPAYFKKKIGDKICLMGHIDLLDVILYGTPEQIDEDVKEAIKIVAPGGGFIIGTNDCIREETPAENFSAYFKACNKYRNYPIKL